MAADYAIAQFRFLERLLLVHGRWCYRRISLMVTIFGLCSLSIAKRLTFFQRQKSKVHKSLCRLCINCKILKTPKSMRECAITYMVMGRQGFPCLTWCHVFSFADPVFLLQSMHAWVYCFLMQLLRILCGEPILQ
jgi:hypothetical protein